MAHNPPEGSDLESTRSELEVAPDPAPPPASPQRELGGDADGSSLAVLRALMHCTSPEEALIVALDESGFPLAQTRVPRPEDLPAAVVLGRHNRCGLVVAQDPGISLRHLLLVLLSGPGPMRLRCADLGGRGGVQVHTGKLEPACSVQGHLALHVGSTRVFLLPGGEEGRTLLRGDPAEVLHRLWSNPTMDRNGGFRPPADALFGRPRDLGGYRSDPQDRIQHRGVLRLRGHRDERGRVPHRDHALRPQALRQGLVIGRHSDRCSLAGEARNLSRIHALVCQERSDALLVFDLASTNGVRPKDQPQGPSHAVVRITPHEGCLLGQFHLDWLVRAPTQH